MYESPAAEVVEVKANGALCIVSNQTFVLGILDEPATDGVQDYTVNGELTWN